MSTEQVPSERTGVFWEGRASRVGERGEEVARKMASKCCAESSEKYQTNKNSVHIYISEDKIDLDSH